LLRTVIVAAFVPSVKLICAEEPRLRLLLTVSVLALSARGPPSNTFVFLSEAWALMSVRPFTVAFVARPSIVKFPPGVEFVTMTWEL
jgi:hypothetical protein